MKSLKKQEDLITEFDDELWYTTADSMTVYADGRLSANFKDGHAVTLTSEQWK